MVNMSMNVLCENKDFKKKCLLKFGTNKRKMVKISHHMISHHYLINVKIEIKASQNF